MPRHYDDRQELPEEAIKVLDAFEYGEDAFDEARENTEKAVRYVNNDHYDANEITRARELNKPLLKYNIIVPILSALQGNEQLMRRRPRFKPTQNDPEHIQTMEIVQGRWNALNDEQDIEEKFQTAFLDALMAPVGGYIQRNFEMNEEGYLDFTYEVPNNMRVILDPETKTSDYQLEKCRWIIKEGWEPLDVLKDKYGSEFDEDYHESDTPWYKKLHRAFYERFNSGQYTTNEHYDKENDRYRVLEMQERVSRKMFRVYNPMTDEFLIMEPSDFRALKKENPQLRKLAEHQQQKIHITTILPFFGHEVVIDEDAKWQSPNFDIFPIFSFSWNIQVTESTSLVELLMDIQDDINKGKSQTRDYVTQILAGGYFFDRHDKEAYEQYQKKGNQPLQGYMVKDITRAPQPMGPGTAPQEPLMNAENSLAFGDRISMLNSAMRGESGKSGESGRLFEQKVQRASAAINPYFHNVALCRKAVAKDFVDNFGWVYAENERIINVKADDRVQPEIVNLRYAGDVLNDVRNPSLIVELDEGEDNQTVKEENFEKMLALVNIIAQVNPMLVDVKTLVESAPIPGADKMVEHIVNTLENSSQQAQAQQQIEAMKQQLENMEIERNIQTEAQEIDLKQQELQQEREEYLLEDDRERKEMEVSDANATA